MQNINGFGLENFRVFKDKVDFDFAPLTILTGTNNSGKSTVINAWKLLKENFKGFEPDQEFYLNARKLFNLDFNPQSLLDRYGNLDQFVTKNSDTKRVSFSFRTKMKKIDDFAEITFIVKAEKHPLRKQGRIIEYTMRSLNEDKVIFKIEVIENKSKDKVTFSKVKVDLNYFYDEFLKIIERNKNYQKDLKLLERGEYDTKEFNKKYDSNYLWVDITGDGTKELVSGAIYNTGTESRFFIAKIEEIIEEMGRGGICNSLISLQEKEDQERFKKIIGEYYQENEIQSLQHFNRDLMLFLSEVDWIERLWHSDSFKYTLKDPNLFSFEKFINNYGLNKNIESEKSALQGRTMKEMSEITMKDIVETIKHSKSLKKLNSSKEFFEKILTKTIPLFIQKKETEWFDSFTIRNFLLKERSHFSRSENIFQEVIYINLNLLNDLIRGMETSNFLSDYPLIPQRLFSYFEMNKLTLELKRLISLDEDFFSVIMSFVNKWIKNFNIGETIKIEEIKETGFFKFKIKDEKGEIQLADLGFGSSQLISIILSFLRDSDKEITHWDQLRIQQRFLFIKEPEAHIHPALQSKLADLFVDMSRTFNIQIVLETHSEYLIRKLQYLTAKADIDPDFTQIYYFYHPDKVPPGEKQVKKINIKEDGSLTEDFGRGFFDEADNIAMSIWSMNQSQKN